MKTVRSVNARLASARRNKQAGLSLIESLLVLAVLALVLIGAYQVYKSATGDVKAQAMQRSAVTLAGNVNRLYSGANAYTGVSTAAIAASGIVPANLTVTGSGATATISNGWGGTVTVASADSVGATPGDGRFFAIDFIGIEKEDCVAFVSGLVGQAAAVFVAPTLTGTAPAAAARVKVFQGTPNPATLATQCGSATGQNPTVTARFVFQ